MFRRLHERGKRSERKRKKKKTEKINLSSTRAGYDDDEWSRVCGLKSYLVDLIRLSSSALLSLFGGEFVIVGESFRFRLEGEIVILSQYG